MDEKLVLSALGELPFGVGKKLLVEYLRGESSASIKRSKLDALESFGSLAYSKEELGQLLDDMLLNGLLKQTPLRNNRFIKVLGVSSKGSQLLEGESQEVEVAPLEVTPVSEDETLLIEATRALLDGFTPEQRRAIVSPSPNIVCVAGAGSGKTSVLTKRIEVLVTHKGVDPREILAITFTRKAKEEMRERVGVNGVRIETFNSWCEQLLRQHGHLLYSGQVRVASYRDQIQVLHRALALMGRGMSQAVATYFTHAQRRGKPPEKMARIFAADVFAILDYFTISRREISVDVFGEGNAQETKAMEMVVTLCKHMRELMRKKGLRTFSDQLVDALRLLREHPSVQPWYQHVLVDEYQDINAIQEELLAVISAPNIFCVGDPRQSIFGWRGSDIRFITHYKAKYPESSVIALTRNYRSAPVIVDFMNKSIAPMELPSLEAARDVEGEIHVKEFSKESQERAFILQSILMSKIPREEIFVLARTNKQLKTMQEDLAVHDIPCVTRSDDGMAQVRKGAVTLATVHAIKGLEALDVYVMGASGLYFPCRGSEHPLRDMLKDAAYNKAEEERRLFYVAVSRAKRKLCISYTGKPTRYLNGLVKKEKKATAQGKGTPLGKSRKVVRPAISGPIDEGIVEKLKSWRAQVARERGLRAYLILHNKSIEDIAAKKPSTIEELKTCHGLGDYKIQQYGKAVLDVIQ